jgi:ATP-dependent DNA helicase DinG
VRRQRGRDQGAAGRHPRRRPAARRGVSGRIAPASGEVNPVGPIERFLLAALEQLRARTSDNARAAASNSGMECSLHPGDRTGDGSRARSRPTLAAVEAPLLALSRHLEDILDDESAELDGASRARIEGALRGLDRRARMTLPGWRSMLAALEVTSAEADPDFLDWLSAEAAFGRIMTWPCAATGSIRPCRWKPPSSCPRTAC